MSKSPTTPELRFQRFELDNGLEVILHQDRRLPLVAVNIWYHVGPANERPGLTGFAHLFEHMMFEGSRNVGPEEHFRYLEAAGASEINGTTDFDRTNYFETLPSNQLELALWLESDRMGFLLDKLDARKLENQRDVVRNERRQSVENTPYGLVEEALFHTLFPKSHPYHASVIGSHSDIESARLPDVREFFKLYYAPNNASLAIVGDIEPEPTKKLVDKYFGSIPAGPPVPKIDIETPPINSEKRVVVGDQVELPRVYMGWITPPVFQPGDAECDLAAKIIGGGKASRLYKRLVYEKRIAQDVGAMQYSLALGSVFSIHATSKPGITAQALERAIDEELESFCREGPNPSELAGAQNTIETAVIRGLETLGGFGGIADRLNMYNHFLGDPGYLPRDLERIRTATAESVAEVAREHLRPHRRVVIHGVPGTKVIEDVPKTSDDDPRIPLQQGAVSSFDEPWRTQSPAPAPSSSLVLPAPTAFTLDNGLTVYLIKQEGLPIVSANVIVMSGSDRNPPDRPGLASFTAEMLDEGTARRSALRIAEDADQLGASISTGSTADYSFVAFRALERNADATFELAGDLLLNPAFPENEVERIRHDRATEIMRQRDNPNAIAGKAFIHAVYGQNHPYGKTELGTEESVNATKREDIHGFWERGFTPPNSALVVAGDLSVSEVRALAQKHLGAWKGEASAAAIPQPESAGSRRLVIVDKPGSPQTVLRVGHEGVERSNPDYVAIDIMNTALGGLFSSRINLNLREEHGYTYGASSVFIYRRGRGPFLVATGVQTEFTAAAVAEIIKEMKRMGEDLLSAEELAVAKESIARSLPGLFETTPQAASTVGQLYVYGLPLHYYSELPDRIAQVQAEDIRRVARKYLRPDRAVVVAVGDLSKIGPDLDRLNLGRMELYDSTGVPIDA